MTELAETKTELDHARRLESVGQLAAGVAHDINHTLGIIKNYARFLKEDLLEYRTLTHPRVREDIEAIDEAVQQGEMLAQQLVTFSSAGVCRPTVFNINDVIDGVRHLLNTLPVIVRCDLKDNLWMVKADLSKIKQVLMNLALNAVDATNGGGQITITTENHEEEDGSRFVQLRISDNGCGMDDETLIHAFEPYYTTKGPHGTASGGGTGLGLSTVYGIVQQAGGRVEITSVENKGTTVIVWLPVS